MKLFYQNICSICFSQIIKANHTIASLETHFSELKMSSHDRFQNLETRVGDLEESHVNLSSEVTAIASKVESIEQAKLAFDVRADSVEEKFASLCENISKGWNHIKDHSAGIALLLSEVSNLKDDLNEFKIYTENEMNRNRQTIAEVESSSSRNLGWFLPIEGFLFLESLCI